jgi:hypothetical protein
MRRPIALTVVFALIGVVAPAATKAQDDTLLPAGPAPLIEIAAAPFLDAESATRRPAGRRVLGDDPSTTARTTRR